MQTECIIDFETSLSCGVHCLPTFMPAFVLFLSYFMWVYGEENNGFESAIFQNGPFLC